MDEAFLHFIWKFQKFSKRQLQTTTGEVIHVFSTGTHNHDSGPDFSEARIHIGQIDWVGQVEIHIKSSDWNAHNHSTDTAYENVVLHVVWQHDKDIHLSDHSILPTLELKSLVNPDLLINYKKYLNQPATILCSNHLKSVPQIIWNQNLDGMLTRRLEQKSGRILSTAESYIYDWEETAYVTLARNFGFSLNADTFERLAIATPHKYLLKHADQPDSIHALLFGQAGFLDEPKETYQQKLSAEYSFLKAKYKLEGLSQAHWKMGKMRPTNFPSVRLVQFAALLLAHQRLFSLFSQIGSLRELKRVLKLNLSEYWNHHYDFGKPLKKGTNQIGNKSIENLIINSVAPLLAAFAIHKGEMDKMDKATNLLQQLSPESNRYTRPFEQLGKSPSSAFDSQALITLYKDFCNRKKCLNCAVGASIFNL